MDILERQKYLRKLNDVNVKVAVLNGLNDAQFNDKYGKCLNDAKYIPRYLSGRGMNEKTTKRRKVCIISGRGASVVEVEQTDITMRENTLK